MFAIQIHVSNKSNFKFGKDGKAYKEVVGTPWIINTKVPRINQHSVANAIYILCYEGALKHYNQVDKVTYFGKELQYDMDLLGVGEY
jgi:hypothetical protein